VIAPLLLQFDQSSKFYDKMSRHNKMFGKRGTSGPVASIQFDKLITDNTKRPSASKSAGVVGKWGTTSFTSLRSSQVNGGKTAKRGGSPVKCFQSDYVNTNSQIPNSGSSANSAYSFESKSEGSTENVPALPKPRKFFKSRATEDSSKAVASGGSASRSVKGSAALSNSFPDYHMNNTEFSSSSNVYAASGNVGYISPTYSASSSKSPAKRGRGRPRGSRTTSPRGSLGSSKPVTTRGASRGRRRSGRSVRGQQGAGRGKRKRQEWEQSESEEDVVSSEPEDFEPKPSYSYPAEQVMEEAEEEEEEEEEDEEEENGDEHLTEMNETSVEEPPKPPIKLRIIRRNDSDGFVSKVGSDATENDPGKIDTPPPPAPPSTFQPQIDLPIPPSAEQTESERVSSLPVLPAPNSPGTDQYAADQNELRDEVEPEPPSTKEKAEKEDVVEEAPCEAAAEAAEPVPVEDCSAELPLQLQPSVHQMHKKSSIFKSRFTSNQDSSSNSSSLKKSEQVTSKGRKGLALYRHKWHEDDANKSASGTPESKAAGAIAGSGQSDPALPSPWDDDVIDESPNGISPLVKMTRPSKAAYSDEMLEEDTGSISSLKCSRKAKDYYTVVRNVKRAHQIQESGEFQEFNDDVDYILDALKSQNPTATRCLSAMSLASKCMEPAFRMHLRAHSTVAKFFQALKDAPSHASVALCTSCIMFVLTQDRLNMDLDRDSLELMLNLLEIDTGIGHVDVMEDKELGKNKLKVRELCEEMVRKGHAPHLQLDKITAAQLAMETLLSLTSKKAGEWFKEELRVLGGLDHIIQTVTVCTVNLTSSVSSSEWNWDKSRLDALKKVDRCLRVLENVTFQNEENQNYLLEFSDGQLVDVTLKLLELLSKEVVAYSHPVTKDSFGHLLSETLSNLMKVMMNLTHDSNDDSLGSRVYGEKPLTWQTTLTCLLRTSPCLAEDKRFDVITLALGILINLVERSPCNQDRLLSTVVPASGDDDDIFTEQQTTLKALIGLFINKEESARLEEARTDAILDGKPPGHQPESGSSQPNSSGPNDTAASAGKAQEDAMEETVKKLLHKAGRHMEDSMVAAYVSLLIGYIVMKQKHYELQVKELLPDKKFTLMIMVLKKFYEFLKLTANAVTTTRGLKNTELVIKYMEASDKFESTTGIRPKETACSSMSDDDL